MKYKNTLVSAKCPVCKCSSAQLLWTISSEDAALHFISPAEDSSRYHKLLNHLKDLWGQASADVIRCDHCKFVYCYPFVAGDKDFYDLAFTKSDYPQWKWEFDVALKLIQRSNIHAPRILELGAGDGAFIKGIINSVTDKENIVAFEYSEFGSKKIQKLGVNCFVKDVRTASQLDLGEKFDFIFMFQALEHMGDIYTLLNHLKGLLNNGGQIIFAVPNEKRIEFNECNGALLDMPPNHIGRWNQSAFQIYAKECGFELIGHQYESVNVVRELIRFMIYRFLRRSQNIHSVDNFVRYRSKGFWRKFLLLLMLAVDFFLGFSTVARFIKNAKKLGISQLAQLRLV